MNIDIVKILKDFGIEFKDRYTDLVTICPFHDEKTASLFIKKDTGIFHCFGCDKSGTFVEYLAEVTKQDLYDTLCWVESLGTFSENKEKIRKTIANLDDLQKTYLLFKYKANRYLSGRGVICPEIFECGYDSWRDRLTIPVKFNGKLVGFESRTLKPLNDYEKYKALYFPKTNYLYGWDMLDVKYPFVVLVESAISVMYLSNTLKIKNALAFMGTSVSEKQIELLHEINPEIIFCWFDNDFAGEKAFRRIRNSFPKSIKVQSTKDPDEYSIEEVLRRL